MKRCISLLLIIICTIQSTLKIGHRGACGYESENTIASFKKALELSVDMVELDVFVCKSGEVVVFHDDTVDRMTDGTGLVTDKTLTILKQLKVNGTESISTLPEVLDCINRRTQVLIELKGQNTEAKVADIINTYTTQKGWSIDSFIFMALDHFKLKRIKELLPKAQLAPCLIGIPLNYAEFAQKMGAVIVVTGNDTVTQAYVDDAHKRGLLIFVSGHDKETIERMEQLNVDGIISNYPDLID